MRHFDPDSLDRSPPAAEPVARLTDLSEVQAWCVAALRQWRAGPDGQAALWNALAVRAGPTAARGVLGRFEALVGLVRDHGAWPLRCRGIGCGLVALEEASFARLVETSATGPREEALMRALVMVRADLAPAAVGHAQGLGLALLRLAPATVGSGSSTERVPPARNGRGTAARTRRMQAAPRDPGAVGTGCDAATPRRLH